MIQHVCLACIAVMVLMWVLYVVGVQYLRGGFWRLVMPVTIAAVVLDILLNYSLFAVLTVDFPRRGELTFSRRLNRLAASRCWRGAAARWTAKMLLDWPAPGGQHIYPKTPT